MRKKRIIFFGTPKFAVICLKKLLEEGYKIIGVVTVADKPAGRGKKLKPSEVKTFSLKNKIDLFQPKNMKEPSFVSKIKSLTPDLIIVVAFRMIPKVIWEIPVSGSINLHASLLPNYRGAAPINWVIINNEKHTGVTTFYINDVIDSGDILLQKKVYIPKNETAGSLQEKLSIIGSELICETIAKLSKNQISSTSQKIEKKIKLAPKIDKNNSHIKLNKSLKEIEAMIRGLNPYPGAWVLLEGEKESIVMRIFDSDLIICNNLHKSNTLIAKDKKILISHSEGFLVCKQIQLPNKKRMLDKDLLNGYTFEENICVK